jgi:hypothetical protein
MFLIVTGGVIAAGIGLAALYDYRSRRRGSAVSAVDEEAFHSRVGVRAQTIGLVHRRR